MKEKDNTYKKKQLRTKRAFIFFLILCIGIGFAYLTSELTIRGITGVSRHKWSIYFDNIQINNGSVTAVTNPTIIGKTTTSLEYTVNLNRPGDYYEFTVDAVNDGTLNAEIELITMTTLDNDVEKYLNYTATYEDGKNLKQGDLLYKNSTQTYKIRVEFKEDVNVEDLDTKDNEFNLSFGVKYVQSSVSDDEPEKSVFVQQVKSSAILDSTINFKNTSSASNGKGLYIKSGTGEDTYPIYPYRGAVENNNAKFAGFCWKVVRTTETGGTKLLYNGLPDEDGYCNNLTGDKTQIQTSKFNENSNSPAYAGYMYGTVYEIQNNNTINSNTYSYGSSFEFVDEDESISGDGTYTLVDATTDKNEISTHHYTCFNETGECSELYYIYLNDNSKAYYITLMDGKSIEDAYAEMNTNTNSSTVKTAVDNWFNNTFKTYFTTNNKDYDDYLEDTVWCNDRSINANVDNGWTTNGSTNNYLWYSAYDRRLKGTPIFTCPNKNDSFTVEESSIGNGALTYPVGLLTSDEMMLAGGQNSINAYYLYTNENWWTMSPYYFNHEKSYNFVGHDDGSLKEDYADNDYGVRPSISLAPGVKMAANGDGTVLNPYEFVLE